MEECVFYIGTVRLKETCSILTECNCFGCKFFKTEKQLDESRKAAEQRLSDKGLRRVKKRKPDGREYITTEKQLEVYDYD